MSHLVQIQTEVRDVTAIQRACQRLQLQAPVEGTFHLFTQTATGWGVELPEWRYPVVCQPESGQVVFDNYEGRWGEQRRLDQFLQAYAVEKVHLSVARQGRSLTEQTLEDGSILLTVSLGAEE